jgi:hypothetical protein
MFHRYILPAVGRKPVDFDRARILMDKDLLRQAVSKMKEAGGNGAQWVWDWYCERHREKYGTSFRPDVDPTWDT